MVARGQWVVLPYSAVKDMPGLRASPPGVIPQHGRRPRWIVDYSYWGINEETLPLAALESMQFGRALDRILREILLANPEHGPVHLLKIDLSDGFYRVDVNPDDIPKLGVVFPTRDGEEQLMAFPLVLPPLLTLPTQTLQLPPARHRTTWTTLLKASHLHPRLRTVWLQSHLLPGRRAAWLKSHPLLSHPLNRLCHFKRHSTQIRYT
jgi:hypothetical protein